MFGRYKQQILMSFTRAFLGSVESDAQLRAAITLRCIAVVLCVSLLTACGGGSEGQIPDRIPPIQVSANVDITVNEQTQVDIEGAGIGGQGSLTYTWQADSSISISQSSASSANATITTPIVTEVTQYTLTLVATDERDVSAQDSFVLTVNPVNLPPVAAITMNSLQNYPNGSFPVSAEIILDGSVSTDEDAPTGQDPIAAYQWQQIAGTLIPITGNLQSSRLELVTPITEQQETIIFELEVTDQEGATSTTQAEFTLLGQSGTLPELVFNAFQDGFSGERLLLDATATSAAPNAVPFSYLWQERSGNYPDMRIEQSDRAVTFVTLPYVEMPTQLVFEAMATDSFNNTVMEEKTVMVYPYPQIGINDTGAYESSGQNLSPPGSDSDFGRDRSFASGVLTKVGRGLNAFDFTRLNSNGDPVDTPTDEWSCVRDNLTGLIWEVKTDDNTSLHYANQHFTWYQDDFNGNFPGEVNPNSTSCNISSGNCNTQAFLIEVNRQGLCGFFDWRIPTHEELQSVVHYGLATNPLVDTDFLPNWGSATDGFLWYWTKLPSADGLSSEEARNAWAIDFNSAVDNVLSKNTEAKLRLVRAGRVEGEN